jgi:Carboxypeptidase regulatory-like domain
VAALFKSALTQSLLIAVLLLVATGLVSAQSITGTVTNGTTGKPAAGADVTLLSLSQGMQEIGSTKTDAQGKFSFPAPSDRAPHMVRVDHGGVGYFPQGGPIMPGASTAEVTVYDTAKKLDGLSQTVEVDRYQSEDGKQLQVIALFAIQNGSNPPRTMDADRTFSFVLPAGAQLDSSDAKGPGGQPIQSPTNATGQKNTYAFDFPLKPGETQFQISYHMPYSGEASFAPKPLADVQHFVVMLPKGMTFTPKNTQLFQSMPDKSGSTIMVATNVKAGQELAYSIAGSGVFQAEGQEDASAGDNGGGGAMGGGQAAANDNRPGGGLGAPIDAPDPLYNYRAVILGGFAVVLVMGGFYVISKTNHQQHPAVAEGPRIDAPVTGDRSTILFEAMKEELFQLEIDRQQGKVSEEEYAKAKAALDETMRRALARKSS